MTKVQLGTKVNRLDLEVKGHFNSKTTHGQKHTFGILTVTCSKVSVRDVLSSESSLLLGSCSFYSPLIHYTLCPNKSDAKFHVAVILRGVVVFEWNFHSSYYYVIDISAADYNRICRIFSEMQMSKIFAVKYWYCDIILGQNLQPVISFMTESV